MNIVVFVAGSAAVALAVLVTFVVVVVAVVVVVCGRGIGRFAIFARQIISLVDLHNMRFIFID